MYRGFNLEYDQSIDSNIYTSKGIEIYQDIREKLIDKAEQIISYDGIIDGNEVIKTWFPAIECDIFLSHSHKDKYKAIALAGLLWENFGLKTFIDSTIWGFSDDLLKILDNRYCLHENGENYSYEKRNYSTSHVHMMLNSALNKMIDNCEAVFFLNTPNSISPNNTIKNSTNSPWIFSEIATTQIIQKKTPARLKPETRMFSNKTQLSESAREQLTVEYQMDLNHLTKIDYYSIVLWINQAKDSNKNPLDILYSTYPLKEKYYLKKERY